MKQHQSLIATIPEPIKKAVEALLAPHFPGLTYAKLEVMLSVDTERETGEELVPLSIACSTLKISMPTLRRLIEAGDLRRIRIRRRVFVRADDIQAIIAGKAPRKDAEPTETQPTPEAKAEQSRPGRKQW